MLIRGAELDGRTRDVRCKDGRIESIAEDLPPESGEEILEAAGGALLPGLHDHHIHLMALAADLGSVDCGPAALADAGALGRALRKAAAAASTNVAEPRGWVRGTGYHDRVAGPLDRERLDAIVSDRPLRIQHRGGAMWFVNSRAIEALGLDRRETPSGVERDERGRATGRLFRLDRWLRGRLPRRDEMDLAPVGRLLARRGVTGVSDASASNGLDEARLLRAARASGALPQHLLVMGGPELDGVPSDLEIAIGPHKILLDEPELPEIGALVARIRRAHQAERPVAFHCVTRTEIHFALMALSESGARSGDRLEHASVAPPEASAEAKRLGLTVVTQPNFIAERGDDYQRDVEPGDLPHLYRVRSWREAGVALGGGSDAPYGRANPWRAMRAATERRTRAGLVLGPDERVSPEAALDLFTTAAEAPGGPPRRVVPGAPADLCLLDVPWSEARETLGEERVAATVVAGRRIWPPNGG